MEKIQPLYTLSVEEAESLFKNWFRQCLEEKGSNGAKLPRYYTRKEAREVLNISFPTLHKYQKMGLVTSCKIGTRVLFSEEDLKNCLQDRKKKC